MYLRRVLPHSYVRHVVCITRVCVWYTARPEAWARRGRVINNVRLFEINFNEEGDCCDLDKHGVGGGGGATSGGGRAGRSSVGRSFVRSVGLAGGDRVGRTAGQGDPRDFPSATDAR